MKFLKITLLIVIFTILFQVSHIKAQVQDESWSRPFRLSSEKGEASEGYITSDQYGFVHVFWTETGFSDQRTSIQYARFDGNIWSNPVDIYVTAPGTSIPVRNALSPFVDSDGQLHLVWTEGNSGPVYYASVPAHDASSAQNWSLPLRIDIPAFELQLKVDSKGVLHLLYIQFFGQDLGIYYTRSEDRGESWTLPVWLDPDIPINQFPARVQLVMDEADGLHAVWYYNNDLGVATWARYTHSLDGGENWSRPLTIDDLDGGISVLPQPILAVQDQSVHIVWGGAGSSYRNHLISNDRGQTWLPPNRIFGDLHGAAEQDSMVTDADGRIHFAGQIRPPAAIYHAYWDQDEWKELSSIYLLNLETHIPALGGIHAHAVRLALRNGNQLITIFTTSPGDPQRILYAMQRTPYSIPPATSAPTPSPIEAPSNQPETSDAESNQQVTTPTAAGQEPTFETSSEVNTATTGSAIWIGVLPAFIVLGGILTIRFFWRRKQGLL
ncbi:MAG: hypothetical protein GY796_01520 [Chloroflexi bacterium]|nr:hypothetical protein [Chloroflexota bacterium]